MQNARRSTLTIILVSLSVLPIASFGSGPAAGGAVAAEAAGEVLAYTVQSGDTLLKICSRHRHLTNHYSLTDMLTAIRRANGLESNFLRIGQVLEIPVEAEPDYEAVTDPLSAGAELRGIYLTGPACGVSSVLARVDRFIEAGGNAVVFDAKDIDGAVSCFVPHPLASWGEGRTNPVISSLDDMLDRFEQRGLYVMARIALFLDGELGRRRPDLALRGPDGEVWSERGCVWVDPVNPEVVAYNLALAAEMARAGVDEIQFDYVRFPTNGWVGVGAGALEVKAEARRKAIADFLTAARDTLAAYDVRISADLYGIMAWGQMEDLVLTGQHVPTIASLVDVICPMIYPSHFGPGFEGRRRPGDDPGYFIGEGTRRFREMVAGQAEIRPWLQAFPYRVTRFDGAYIETQVHAARAAGGEGWCLWNPACRYDVALDVLPALCSGPVISRADSPGRDTRSGPAVSRANPSRIAGRPTSGRRALEAQGVKDPHRRQDPGISPENRAD